MSYFNLHIDILIQSWSTSIFLGSVPVFLPTKFSSGVLESAILIIHHLQRPISMEAIIRVCTLQSCLGWGTDQAPCETSDLKLIRGKTTITQAGFHTGAIPAINLQTAVIQDSTIVEISFYKHPKLGDPDRSKLSSPTPVVSTMFLMSHFWPLESYAAKPRAMKNPSSVGYAG